MNIKTTFFGFTNELKPMQKAKIESTLNNTIRYNGVIYTYKEFVYIKLTEGATPELVENHQTYKKNGELTQPKNDYRLTWYDEKYQCKTWNTLNKTMYDYAYYILENGYLDEEKYLEAITV